MVLRDAVGLETFRWLRALPSAYRMGDYFFCHAGVRPGIALEEQRREDLLWIRQEFLNSPDFHGAIIVHGHSETQEVEIRPNRISVDTSAYRSSELTAVAIQGPYRWFISTARKYLHRSDLDATRRLVRLAGRISCDLASRFAARAIADELGRKPDVRM